MADRILTWYIDRITGDGTRQGPTYYLDTACEAVALRLYARVPPTDDDLQVDILADGVSIMGSGGAILTKGDGNSDMAEDFDETRSSMVAGAWVSLDVIKTGGAKDISVHLETQSLSDADEEED